MTSDAAPLSVTLAADALTLHWSDGESTVSATKLREGCRCAPCQSARLRGNPAAAHEALTLVDALPIGHYAVQLRFSDGHERGIYPWAYLRELAGERSSAFRCTT
jgi:DUF971 family protein